LIKVSFLGPTRVGKTTAAGLVTELFGGTNLKLAEPLFELQQIIYSYIGKNIGSLQDGELLQFLGAKIQREIPDFLANDFCRRVLRATYVDRSSLITNDDCRPHNYPYLKALDFIFVEIRGPQRLRSDQTAIDPSQHLEWQPGAIEADHVLENVGDLAQYSDSIRSLMEGTFG
jgi:hypothetical protein